MRLASATLVTTTLLALAAVPSVSAGSALAPEITDPAGDVSPAAFAINTPDNESLFQNVTAYDVVSSWIGLESQDDVWLFIHVKDLPDGWGVPVDPPPQSPFGSNATFSGTSLVANFTVGGENYQAIAKLAMPEAGGLMDNYTLWRDGEFGILSGAYNTTEDWIAMQIPKEAVGDPADGAKLSQFWVLGRFGDRSMDFAPDAEDLDVGGTPDPTLILKKLTGQQLVEPQYGSDYTFGQYPRPGPGGGWVGPGGTPAPTPDLDMTVEGALSQKVAPGGVAQYSIRLTNHASAADTILLALNSAEDGWSHQLTESQFDLGPGESRAVLLTVSASDQASQPLRSLVSAASSLGASKSIGVLTTLTAPAEQPGSTSPAPSSSSGPAASSGPAKKKSPGFEPALVVAAALGALLWAGSRRRRAE